MRSAGFFSFAALFALVVFTAAAGAETPVRVEAVRQAIPAGIGDPGDGFTVEAAFVLHSSNTAFGGLSGLWIAPDAASMLAVSDTGKRWRARLLHDASGGLTGVDDWTLADLRPPPESRLRDAEALAEDGEGGLVVAYEGRHGLIRWPLDDLDGRPDPLPVPLPDLGGPSNSGMEALAALGRGRLFAIGERVGAHGGTGLMAWIVDARGIRRLVYVPAEGFAPVGADRLEDRVYVIERQFSWLAGFRNRIAYFPASAARPGAEISGEPVATFRWGDFGENFEGIAARRGSDGRTRLYLLADDNFSFLQKTLLVQLALPNKSDAD